MRMRYRFIGLFAALLAGILLTGCASPGGETPAEQRSNILAMRADALNTLFSSAPEMRQTLDSAPGYGAFSGINTQSIFMSTGNGYGVIRDNATGKDTFMRAFKLGGGLGAGIQDIRAIVVFHDKSTMQDVLSHGWAVTGKAEANARVDHAGAGEAVVITLPGMSIYRFTKNGAMIGGAIEGAKIWPDEKLNQD